MCPVIRISDETFELLQEVAKPLVDTPDTAIRRVLDAYLNRSPISYPPVIDPAPTGGQRDFDPNNPPNLTHSSFLSGKVDGVIVKKWNYLLLEAHVATLKRKNGNVGQLIQLSGANVTKGSTVDKGYHTSADGRFSVQAVEANKAWKLSLDLAQLFDFEISVEFRWQQKPSAAYPGRLGRLVWTPGNAILESRITKLKTVAQGR